MYCKYLGPSENGLSYGNVYKIQYDADENIVRVRVCLLNTYHAYDIDKFYSYWAAGSGLHPDKINELMQLSLEIKKLQAELDRKKEEAIKMMGKEYDDMVIG